MHISQKRTKIIFFLSFGRGKFFWAFQINHLRIWLLNKVCIPQPFPPILRVITALFELSLLQKYEKNWKNKIFLWQFSKFISNITVNHRHMCYIKKWCQDHGASNGCCFIENGFELAILFNETFWSFLVIFHENYLI